MRIKVFFFLVGLIPQQIFGQDIDQATEKLLREYQKQIEQIMESSRGGLGKMLEEMMKDFDNDSFFNDPDINNFLKAHGLGGERGANIADWSETENERILTLHFTSSEDSPLDLKVENGKIFIKGQIVTETKERDSSGKEGIFKSSRMINLEYSIPNDVEASSVSFENKDGKILAKFKKKNIVNKQNEPNPKNERRPITPTKDGITI